MATTPLRPPKPWEQQPRTASNSTLSSRVSSAAAAAASTNATHTPSTASFPSSSSNVSALPMSSSATTTTTTILPAAAGSSLAQPQYGGAISPYNRLSQSTPYASSMSPYASTLSPYASASAGYGYGARRLPMSMSMAGAGISPYRASPYGGVARYGGMSRYGSSGLYGGGGGTYGAGGLYGGGAGYGGGLYGGGTAYGGGLYGGGGGYGLYGGGGGVMGPMGPMGPDGEEMGGDGGGASSWLARGFQKMDMFAGLVEGISRFAGLLEMNFEAFHGSLASVADFWHHVGAMGSEFRYTLQTFTVVRLAYVLYSRLAAFLRRLLVRLFPSRYTSTSKHAANASHSSFFDGHAPHSESASTSGNPAGSSVRWWSTLLLLLGVVATMRYLAARLLHLLAPDGVPELDPPTPQLLAERQQQEVQRLLAADPRHLSDDLASGQWAQVLHPYPAAPAHHHHHSAVPDYGVDPCALRVLGNELVRLLSAPHQGWVLVRLRGSQQCGRLPVSALRPLTAALAHQLVSDPNFNCNANSNAFITNSNVENTAAVHPSMIPSRQQQQQQHTADDLQRIYEQQFTQHSQPLPQAIIEQLPPTPQHPAAPQQQYSTLPAPSPALSDLQQLWSTNASSSSSALSSSSSATTSPFTPSASSASS